MVRPSFARVPEFFRASAGRIAAGELQRAVVDQVSEPLLDPRAARTRMAQR